MSLPEPSLPELAAMVDALPDRVDVVRFEETRWFAPTEADRATLSRLVYASLDVAEDIALRKLPITMQDWQARLNRFLSATDREVLSDAGNVIATIAHPVDEDFSRKWSDSSQLLINKGPAGGFGFEPVTAGRKIR